MQSEPDFLNSAWGWQALAVHNLNVVLAALKRKFIVISAAADRQFFRNAQYFRVIVAFDSGKAKPSGLETLKIKHNPFRKLYLI